MSFARERSTRLNHKLPKLDGWVSSILVIAGLLAILGGAACQGGMSDTTTVQLERELPDAVTVGEEFVVTVTFTSPEDGCHAIGLTDVGPAGWDVNVDVAWTEPQAMGANTPGTGKAEYIWEGPHDAGVEFTASYKIRVPVDAEPGAYTFSGSLEYYIEPFPAPSYEEEIAGDMQVTVSQGLQPHTDELFDGQVGAAYDGAFAVSSGINLRCTFLPPRVSRRQFGATSVDSIGPENSPRVTSPASEAVLALLKLQSQGLGS